MKDLADALRSEVAAALPPLRSLGDAETARDRGPGTWCRKETLGHLIDSAANNHQRFVRAQLTERLVMPGYDQARWVAVQGYRERAWSELVDLWAALNLHLAQTIERVPADRLGTACLIGEHEPQPLEWWMRDYLRHLRHHLEQIGDARRWARAAGTP